jgi:endonuclease YncB( thermonuclease family)
MNRFLLMCAQMSGWRGVLALCLLGFGGVCLVTAGLPLAHAASVRTASWSGTVTHVTDGDTLWVRSLRGAQAHKIRLDGIDAPEICQAYGSTARDRLASRVMGQMVQVKVRRQDSYGRSLAHISLSGQDIGAWMVLQGSAWSYRYRRDPGPYAHQEAQARSQRLGLFGESQPERPRDFRLRHGSCH